MKTITEILNIEDLFVFNSNIIQNYKDSVFYKNIRELELLYNIRYFLKSIRSPQMNTEQIEKLIFALNKTYYNRWEKKLDNLSDYTISLLKEPYINYYKEYLNITLISI